MKEWGEIFCDPRTIDYFTATTGIIWIEEQQKSLQTIKEIDIPILFIEGDKDDVIKNEYIKMYSQMAQNHHNLNEYVSIEGCDHSLTAFHPSYAS